MSNGHRETLHLAQNRCLPTFLRILKNFVINKRYNIYNFIKFY